MKNAKGLLGVLLIIFCFIGISPPGFSAEPRLIVTDIDDTIKATHITNPLAAFYNGLFGKKAFAGMAPLYQSFVAIPSTNLFYLSGAPRVLNHKTINFLRQHQFPSGRIFLRNVFTERDPYEYKLNRLEKLAANPEGEFILIGDDTEHDPEVFAEFLRRHPDRVLSIYIHQITGREIPSTHRPFFTSFDIAVWEYLEGRLSPENLRAIAHAITNVMPDTVLVPKYAKCPPQETELPGLDSADLAEMQATVNAAVALECAPQSHELSILN